jgi:hypothetical protein
MKHKKKCIALLVVIILVCGMNLQAQSSTAAIRELSGSRIEKANGDVSSYLNRLASMSASVEQLTQGKFTILLNPVGNGQYELQVYRMVAIGNKRVMSIFTSVFKAGIEYSYSFDSRSGEIRQHHYICPPDSLTCWSNPGDYASMKEFSWKEAFPAKTCTQSVFTSEEYGREYVQASCFPNRDSALNFAQEFIKYVGGTRGM